MQLEEQTTLHKTTFGRTTLTTSQELDRAQERADKAAAELRRTQAELRVTQKSSIQFKLQRVQLLERKFNMILDIQINLLSYTKRIIF
ncbi:hypothetical protein DOY81_013754 [Sarcophaga bullata]|nr:hypothetical protein DOY81_013754 [Sarcophaga bullata]